MVKKTKNTKTKKARRRGRPVEDTRSPEEKAADAKYDKALKASRQMRDRMKEIVGQRVEYWLKRTCTKPSELARKAGVHRNVISTCVSRKNLLSAHNARLIAHAIGEPADFLTPPLDAPTAVDRPAQVFSDPLQPGKVMLRIQETVEPEMALTILQMLGKKNKGVAV